MRLNPFAAEFVPAGPWSYAYTGWGVRGHDVRRAAEQCTFLHIASNDAPECNLLDVPEEVLAEVVGKLRNPADVLAVALVSKRMRQTVGDSLLRLRIEKHHLGADHSFLKPPNAFFSGLLELDLSGCEGVEGSQLLAAIRQMPRLNLLDVSACRKLTSDFVDPAFSMMQPPEGSGPGLQALGMQRCFRLDCRALSHILEAASATSTRLKAATLSHLSLQDWPSQAPEQRPHPCARSTARLAVAYSVCWTSLKILALNNCTRISSGGLSYLAACCPDLAFLLLGGSTTEVAPHHSLEIRGAAPPGPLGVPSSEVSIGGGPSLEACYTSPSGAVYRPHTPASYYARLASTVVEALQGLAGLNTLELTFFDPEVVAEVSARLPGIQVWDLTCLKSLRAAAEALKESDRSAWSTSSLSLALKAAVNCSSLGRQSPLHAAVERDCKSSLEAVLELGGQVDAKDRSGATPLFLACETGKLACACTLMRAGAELRTRNSAGEAPLYIAALRGHERIVEELLAEFQLRSLLWTDATYGDDWNPLMAAAVADRHAIAVRLLRSAGCAKGLVTATNRYGQTAAHIAARKGSHMLLMALLNAGGMKIAKIKDNSKKTPLDIARAHRHEAAVSILKFGSHTNSRIQQDVDFRGLR